MVYTTRIKEKTLVIKISILSHGMISSSFSYNDNKKLFTSCLTTHATKYESNVFDLKVKEAESYLKMTKDKDCKPLIEGIENNFNEKHQLLLPMAQG